MGGLRRLPARHLPALRPSRCPSSRRELPSLPGPHPCARPSHGLPVLGAAPSWTSTWLDGSRTGRAGPRGPDHSPRTRGDPVRIRAVVRPAAPFRGCGPFRAQSLRDGPCRHLPDQLAPGRQADQRHGGQSRRRAVAPVEREGACARRPRGGEAWRGTDAAGDLHPRGVLGGRAAIGSATRRAANGKCGAATAPEIFPCPQRTVFLLGDE